MATTTATRTGTPIDEQIQRDVLAELKWDPRLNPNEIGVVVRDGIVTHRLGRLLRQALGGR
jgi:hypothetical protein